MDKYGTYYKLNPPTDGESAHISPTSIPEMLSHLGIPNRLPFWVISKLEAADQNHQIHDELGTKILDHV